MFCDHPSKLVPLPRTHGDGKVPALQDRTVQQIKDPQLLDKLEKMYKAQLEGQDFKEITYGNMVHAIGESSEVNPIMFLLSKGIPPPIPGLVYQPDFLTKNTQQSLYAQAIQLHDKISTHREGAPVYKSQGHNLPFERHYKLLYFEDMPRRKINAQNFGDYGSPGHELTYFINNQNIPDFIHKELITRIRQMAPVQTLASQSETPLNWRFTFNVYKEEGAKQAGFDWHKDIGTNGEITSITTIFGNATFEIRPEDKTSYSATYSLPLTSGSIVLLSGDSRWKWEHRVLSQETSAISGIGRISLVLGCR
jgi:alkylated DNA repair dioxygenase AlkB